MIPSKKAILISLLFLFFGSSVMAITLTKDSTEKVVVPFAIKGEICKWDFVQLECLEPKEEIIFGRADVYPKGRSKPSSMLLAVFQDKLYRSVTMKNGYDETNCREEDVEVRICKAYSGATVDEEGAVAIVEEEEGGQTCVEWETIQTTSQNCDITGLANQSGELSLVTESGMEFYDKGYTYFVSYNEGTSKKVENQGGGFEYYSDDIEYIKLNLGPDLYLSQSIDKRLAEEIIWYPK